RALPALHQRINIGVLRLDLDLIRVRAVSLSDVEELFSDADGFARNADEFGSGFYPTLRAQRFVKEHPHGIQNSIALRDCFLLSLNLPLGQNGVALVEFAAEKDGLLDEGKMLALFVEGARAEFFARVADDRVRPEAGLRSPALGGADRRLRLSQRRIGLQSHSLQEG